MAENYSIKAILSAADKGFSSTLKSCSSILDRIDSKISGFSFGILTGAGQAAFDAVSNSVSNLVGDVNSASKAWQTFEGNMKNFGKAEDEISSVKKELQDFAETTVYSSSDMASTYAQLETVGVRSMKALSKGTSGLVKGFGGLAAAAEDPQQAMKSLSQQATQMAAKPKVAWEDFKIMLEQSPAGMAAVAKEMGISTEKLISKIQDGKVKTEDFFAAIEKAGNSEGFAKMATEAKTIDQACDGLKESIGNKLLPSFELLSDIGIDAIDGIADKISEIDAQGFVNRVSAGIDNAAKYWNAFRDAFSGVWKEVVEAGSAIKTSLSEITGSFGSVEQVDTFKSAMESVAGGIKAVANFAEKHSGAIAKLISILPGLVIAIKGFKVAKTVTPFIATFASGFTKIASAVGGGLASKLFGVASGTKKTGDAAKTSANSMLATAKSFMMLGVGVLTVALAFGILAMSAIALANAGGGAIAVMFGLIAALALLGAGMMIMLKTLAPMGKKLMPVATAMLALGAAVLLIAVGFALMAQSSIALANAGGLAIGVMVGMVAAIALLAVGAAALGTALTAGAIGFIAFGAAIVLVGVGALLAGAALSIIVSTLPMLVAYGLQGALAIGALGLALVVFGAGALVAGVASVVLGAGLAVVAVGLALVGAAVLVTAVGVLLLASGCLLLGAGLLVVGGALTMITALLPMASAGTLLIVASFTMLLAMSAMLGISLAALAIAMGAFAIAAGASAIGVGAFGIAMATSAVGVAAMGLALKGVSSQMKTISKNAKSAEKSLKSMKSSVKVVESGLDALGSKAKSAMKSLTNAFDNTASKAQTSGKKVGTGFSNGLKSGLAKSPSVAMSTVNSTCAVLSSGSGRAYQAGAFISIGFANGMRSQLGAIRNAAAQMAVAAQQALEAKAKIASPSKVSTKDGQWWGQGLVNGMLDKVKAVRSAAEKLISVPEMTSPRLAMAYGGELSTEYDYTRKAEYNITVVSEIDGKQVAKTTAPYTEEQLDKRQKRANRRKGKA